MQEQISKSIKHTTKFIQDSNKL